ncbi:MAG: DUF1461 domain-containing protein [Patescibacteria group bacterium]
MSFFLLVPMLVLFVMARSTGLHDMLARSVSSGDSAAATGYDSVRSAVTEYLFGHGELPATVFSGREIAHLQDVQLLFMLQSVVLAIAAMVCIGTATYLYTRGAAMADLIRRGAAWGFGPLIAFGVAMALFFDQLFIVLHRVLFTNDYWLLDPVEHILIRAYPPVFFQQFAVITFGIVVAAYLSVWTTLAVFKKR